MALGRWHSLGLILVLALTGCATDDDGDGGAGGSPGGGTGVGGKGGEPAGGHHAGGGGLGGAAGGGGEGGMGGGALPSGDFSVLTYNVAALPQFISGSEPILQTLLSGASLEDACRVLACGDENRIDRVMYRSSVTVQLTATSWQLDPNFVNGNGEPLSDHEPVGVTMHWQAL